MKKLLMLAFVTLVIGMIAPITPSYGQSTQATASGHVYDAFTLEPIIGAEVVAIDQDNTVLAGTITDIDGNYIMSVPANIPYKIKAIFLGYRPTILPIDGSYFMGNSRCEIPLYDDTQLLE